MIDRDNSDALNRDVQHRIPVSRAAASAAAGLVPGVNDEVLQSSFTGTPYGNGITAAVMDHARVKREMILASAKAAGVPTTEGEWGDTIDEVRRVLPGLSVEASSVFANQRAVYGDEACVRAKVRRFELAFFFRPECVRYDGDSPCLVFLVGGEVSYLLNGKATKATLARSNYLAGLCAGEAMRPKPRPTNRSPWRSRAAWFLAGAATVALAWLAVAAKVLQ